MNAQKFAPQELHSRYIAELRGLCQQAGNNIRVILALQGLIARVMARVN